MTRTAATGERFYEADLRRIRGQLLLYVAREEEAEHRGPRYSPAAGGGGLQDPKEEKSAREGL